MTRSVRPPAFRQWRLLRIVSTIELSYRSRVLYGVALIGAQVVLVASLWSALYGGDETVAGANREQTVTYAVLAVLLARVRWSARFYSKDALASRVRDGSVVYWFLRPVRPSRYVALINIGDVLYGSLWLVAGMLLATAAGAARVPDPVAFACFLLSAAIGQAILCHLASLLDLVCFWLVVNENAKQAYRFFQDFLAGAFVPVWLFPGWLTALSSFLPFRSTISVPASLYVGTIPAAEAVGEIGTQVLWCVVLYALVHLVWRRAARRVVLQGG
ncbi:ABC-2 family transporter protein [Saccharopolyspora sp. NPDC050642]|uniref:ABC transporter permease n=1 Tax=Saccharopolyspora sp. NPDC050642 TaxID=3157099 RepID=UPI0033C6C537